MISHLILAMRTLVSWLIGFLPSCRLEESLSLLLLSRVLLEKLKILDYVRHLTQNEHPRSETFRKVHMSNNELLLPRRHTN